MNFFLAFILLIGTTTQIAQSEEITATTTQTQYVYTDSLTSDIESRLSSIWNSLRETTNQGYTWISNAFSNMNKGVQQDASDAKNTMENTASNVQTSMSDTVSYTGDSIRSTANTAGDKMSNAASSVQRSMSNTEYSARESIREGSES